MSEDVEVHEDDIDPRYAAAMLTCPYYQGYGSCAGGCHEEPACQTDEPDGGWEQYLPADFDRAATQRRIDELVAAEQLERWLTAEKRHLERPVLVEMTETGIYPLNPASQLYAKGCRFAAHYRYEGGGGSTHWCTTEAEAQASLDESAAIVERSCATKLAYKEAGDRSIDDRWGTRPPKISPRRNVLRIDGHHYIAAWEGTPNVGYRQGLGYGGRVFRWRWLDEPEGTRHTSNNVWFQGQIPAHWRDRLPDNAVWVTE